MSSYAISFTGAQSGSGKTYSRGPHYLVNQWLPNFRGIHYSNFPLKVPELCDFAAAKYRHLKRDELEARIVVIPADVLKAWAARESGPWDYFADKKLAGAHIAIDECHKYLTNEDSKEWLQSWKDWLGALRHHKLREIEFLSQYETKVSTKIRNEATHERTLFNGENRKEPFLGVLMADWYEMRAKFLTGAYTSTIFESTEIKVKKKSVILDERHFPLAPEYFALYNSYNNVSTEEGETAGEVDHIFQQYSKPGMLKWFLRRNGLQVFSRAAACVFVVWLLFFGGLSTAMGYFVKAITYSSTKSTQVAAVSKPAEPVSYNTGGGSGVLDQPAGRNRAADASPKAGGARLSHEDLVAVLEKIKLVEKNNAELGAALMEYKKQEAVANLISMIDANGVVFRDGSVVAIGETIARGPCAGKSIVSVNLKARRAVLSDGSVLRLSR